MFWRGLGAGVGKLVATGYLMLCLGAALWLYGYFAPHVSSLIDWYRNIPVWMVNYLPPAWMADYLPNLTQVGILLVLVGVVPFLWPWRSKF